MKVDRDLGANDDGAGAKVARQVGAGAKVARQVGAGAKVARQVGAKVDVGVGAKLDDSVDVDLLELLRIMPPVLRALKRQGSGGESGPPQPVAELLASGALGPRHLPVIVVLSLQGSMAVSELAHRIGLGAPATSLMVGELERTGVVERHVDERDRRRTMVSVSAQLRGDCERLARERLAPMREALERMGPDLRSQFLAGWMVLAETVGELESVEYCSD